MFLGQLFCLRTHLYLLPVKATAVSKSWFLFSSLFIILPRVSGKIFLKWEKLNRALDNFFKSFLLSDLSLATTLMGCMEPIPLLSSPFLCFPFMFYQ